MKKLMLSALAVLVASPAISQVYVPGYTRSDGSYVPGHYRSAPDRNPYNNYSAQGNVNPYTGRVGTLAPYQQPTFNPYSGRKRGY